MSTQNQQKMLIYFLKKKDNKMSEEKTFHMKLNKKEEKLILRTMKKTGHRSKAAFVREAIKEKCEAEK